MGSGASLQALTGAFLVRRFVGFPHPLAHQKDVIKFLVLGGPVSCLLNATVSVAWLAFSGSIARPDYLFNWWTWWVGDVIGVILMTPVILIWAAEPREVWRRRGISVAVPLLILLSATIVVFAYAREWEEATTKNDFERRARTMAQAIQDSLEGHVEVLYSIGSFYAASQHVNRTEFRAFVNRLLSRHPSIQGLSWNPYIADAERSSYEAAARREGYPHFQVTEMTENREVVQAAQRPGYVVVYYIEPYEGNERALGYDVASDPIRLEALVRARDEGQPIATRSIQLVQETEGQPGFLVLLPVYSKGVTTDSIEQRRKHLLGYATGIFRIPDMIGISLKDLPKEDIELRMYDTNSGNGGISYLHQTGTWETISFPHEEKVHPQLRWDRQIQMAGRLWVLRFLATPAYLAGRRSWYSWGILAAALFISASFGAYFLVVTGHTYQLEQAGQQLQSQADDLSRANKVKDEFLSVMSHEFRTPLVVVMGYSGMLQEEMLGKLNNEQKEALEKIIGQTQEQLTMTNNILQATQIGAAGAHIERDEVLLGQFLDILKSPYDLPLGRDLKLIWDYPPDLPLIRTDSRKLSQILQNLIHNAIKFTETGHVSISVRHDPANRVVEFKVADTGIGIPKEMVPVIFERFHRVDSSETRSFGGVGVGLYIAKSFTEMLGGSVDVESEVGKGSTFTIKLPIE